MSAYSVAKSLVIAKMLEMNMDCMSTLQVWYSSVWSDKTNSDFLKAINAVESTNHLKVDYLLHHSSTVDVPLQVARKEWSERQTESSSFISNLKLWEDKKQTTDYLLTGQLGQGSIGSKA